MRRRVALVAGIVAAALVLNACDGSSAADMTVELAEFSITAPRVISAGTGQVEIDNAGDFTHTLVITDASGEVAAASGLIQPGETTYLDIDLEPGTYSFTCRIVAQDGEGNLIDHYQSGMNATVDVEG